jgi:hypothetical protein
MLYSHQKFLIFNLVKKLVLMSDHIIVTSISSCPVITTVRYS